MPPYGAAIRLPRLRRGGYQPPVLGQPVGCRRAANPSVSSQARCHLPLQGRQGRPYAVPLGFAGAGASPWPSPLVGKSSRVRGRFVKRPYGGTPVCFVGAGALDSPLSVTRPGLRDVREAVPYGQFRIPNSEFRIFPCPQGGQKLLCHGLLLS